MKVVVFGGDSFVDKKFQGKHLFRRASSALIGSLGFGDSGGHSVPGSLQEGNSQDFSQGA